LRARSVGVQVAPRTPIHGLRRCWCGGPPVERMSGDQNPGRSPSGCSSASRAPASGAGGRRSKACHPVQFVVAPLAQLAERSGRRELRTGARLEVRVLQGVPNKRRVAQLNQSAALRQPRSRVRITARRRKAPLNGRRLVPKTRVTARSGVRFLSLPPNSPAGGRCSHLACLISRPKRCNSATRNQTEGRLGIGEPKAL
jgi:hypothetical protein